MDLEGVGYQHSRNTCTSLRKALQLIVVIVVRLLYKPFLDLVVFVLFYR